MARHRKRSPRAVRRTSVIAVTGLIPTWLSMTDTGSDAIVTAVLSAPARPAGPISDSPAAAPGIAWETLREAREFTPPPPDPPKTVVVAAPVADIPGIAVAAYRDAEDALAADRPGCHLPWTLLAGIGRIESDHAFGTADADGTARTPIYGPVLDGGLPGNEIVADSDDGAIDGVPDSDRAVGPMQFLPETWTRYGADGNGDGIADPQNLFDAALTAGRYLCAAGGDLGDPERQTGAVLRYNNSAAYVADVMSWERRYRNTDTPETSDQQS
ncbi:lytic murein transglycosylase [Nocardia sp. NPDC052254]|uniref:lytic transglycosylase domain-containing protein n=1 Tax=Nocardia sp. NPDC052254 TaxID=3155681 RepID=UPI003440F36C